MATEGMQRGMDFLIWAKLKDGKWTMVAGQQGATLNMTAETLDRTSKDAGQWRIYSTSFKEWSLDGDGIVVFGNEAYNYLLDCFVRSIPVDIALTHTDRDPLAEKLTNFMKGKAIITDFSHEFGYEDNATYSMTFQGATPLEFNATTDIPTPPTETGK